MTNVSLSYRDLVGIIGSDIPQEEILEKVPLIGSDIGDNVPGSDAMTIEFFPNRPDMYSVEGIGRALRQFLGVRPGLSVYDVEPSGIRAVVTDGARRIRPYFMCAAVCGVGVDETVLKSIMDLQEKLHITIGRKRAKLAIGIHDLDRVKPPFRFIAVDPGTHAFVPLARSESMTPGEILSKHEKGVAYAHLMDGLSEYPLIVDSEDNVLSFPPIINGALTAVTVSTRNIFVDVTGFDESSVECALNIVCTALAERGGRIRSVEMEGAPKRSYPCLGPTVMDVPLGECRRIIGLDITGEEACAALARMGMDAECSGDVLRVRVPAYRNDILHPIDICEDIAIGHGYGRYGKRSLPVAQTNGMLLPETMLQGQVRDIMIGLGYTEVTTLTLSNHRDEFGISGFPELEDVTVTNPITEDHTCLRSYLMPSLMRILRHNKHRDLPQRIFEVGFVVREHRNVLHLCALQAASRSCFTEVKSLTESVLRELGAEYTVEACGYTTFVPGRGAFIMSGGRSIGVFGEMSPKTVTDYGMTHPVMLMEMDLTGFADRLTEGLI